MLSPPGLHISFQYSWIPSYELVNASLSDVREYSQLYESNWSRFVILDQKSEVCDYADSHDLLVNCARRLPEARNNIISHYYADRERLTYFKHKLNVPSLALIDHREPLDPCFLEKLPYHGHLKEERLGSFNSV